MSDVTDRLDALEAALKANQLPATLAVLQRKLEQTWQPDASVLLQPGTITADILAPIEAIHYVSTFSGTWTNYDAGSPPPAGTARNAGYWKDRDGMVRLCGVIKSGATGTSAFTLPAGYVPATLNHGFITVASGGPAETDISPSGAVVVNNLGAGTNVSTFAFLDGIAFKAGT